MPPARSDVRLLIGATVAAIVAGLIVAALLLAATSRSRGPRHYKPFAAGPVAELRRQLEDGGPFFFADPFGGNRNILFALEHGDVVALWANLPSTEHCTVRWRGSINRFVDCHGTRLESAELARFETRVGKSGDDRGVLLVDLLHRRPPPTQTASPTAPETAPTTSAG